MRELGVQNFDMFLHSFEKMIISTLAERNHQEKKPLLTQKELLRVVFRFYDQSLFE
jgi:hypothetical protein